MVFSYIPIILASIILIGGYNSLISDMPPSIPPKKIKKSKDAKDTLRRCVENLFNLRYGIINIGHEYSLQ